MTFALTYIIYLFYNVLGGNKGGATSEQRSKSMIKLSHKRKMELQNEKAKKNDTSNQQESVPKRDKNAQEEFNVFRKKRWHAPLENK